MSKNQTIFAVKINYISAELEIDNSKIKCITGNPVVFVNTWNHALGETYNSSTFPAYAIQLDLYAGTNSRPGVENIHSTNSYQPWYGLSPLP